jgi:predicted AAA+ superfamily ATPase
MKKVYAMDMGLFTENSIVFSDESGRRLENTVFLHLRRKYKDIFYFTETGECDFIVMEKGKPAEIIQVCYTLNADNMQRELNGLTQALEFFNAKRGKLVTLNQTDSIKTGSSEVDVISLQAFLQG